MFIYSIKMLKQSLNELKQIAKMRGIKGYEVLRAFPKMKKYYDYDDISHRGIRDVKNL